MPETAESHQHVKPFVSETLGSKSLLFSLAAVQSSMNLMQPDALVLEYTQTMMGFLMFNPRPDSIAMIGLGGGSLAKFCYRYLPDTHIVAVEINPHVLALRDDFLIPKDNHRFTVIQGDGALFLRCPPKRYDVLLLDGFEPGGMPSRLCSQRFYEHCHEALHPNGILVANLHTLHPHFDVYLGRIKNVFKDSVLVVEESEPGNTTVFAGKGRLLSPPAKGKLTCPARLPASAWDQLSGAFTHIAKSMR